MRDPISIKGELCLRKSAKIVLCAPIAMHICACICVTHTCKRRGKGKQTEKTKIAKRSSAFFTVSTMLMSISL